MPTLFLEAFGRLSAAPSINVVEEDLYSVFRTRGELMGWTTSAANETSMLWDMEEAELTADTGSDRIGFAQVGLDVGPLDPSLLPPSLRSSPTRGRMDAPSVESPERGGWYGYAPLPYRRKIADPSRALPPLAQCFHDSLSRFGDVELNALQLTLHNPDLRKKFQLRYLASALNWFNANLTEGADAIVTFDQGLIGGDESLIGGDDVSQLAASLDWRNTGQFDFSAIERAPERCIIRPDADNWFQQSLAPPSTQGLLATMPEWSPSAIGWGTSQRPGRRPRNRPRRGRLGDSGDASLAVPVFLRGGAGMVYGFGLVWARSAGFRRSPGWALVARNYQHWTVSFQYFGLHISSATMYHISIGWLLRMRGPASFFWQHY